jgi:hypothetical protein
MNSHLLSNLLTAVIICFASVTSQAQDTTLAHPRFGAGLAIGAAHSLYCFATLSPTIHAGIATGVQGISSVCATNSLPPRGSQIYLAPFARLLFPLQQIRLAPFVMASYFIGLPNASGQNNVQSLGIVVGARYSVDAHLSVTAQLHPLRVGVCEVERFIPFWNWTFPNASIGVEFSF